MRLDMAFLKAEVLIGKSEKHVVAEESAGDSRMVGFCGRRTEEEEAGKQHWLLSLSDC